MGSEVIFKMSKLENQAPGQEVTPLATNLIVSMEPVLVPTFMG